MISNTTPSDQKQQNTITKINPIGYDVKMFSFLAILGILFRIIFGTASKDYATATVWGYGFSVLCIFGLMITAFFMANRASSNTNIFNAILQIFYKAWPIMLSMFIISLVLAQNIYYFNKINDGKVAPQYYQFSGILSFLILVQVCLNINFLMDTLKGLNTTSTDKKDIFNALASQINVIVLILSIVNVAFIGMLQVILEFFSTDG